MDRWRAIQRLRTYLQKRKTPRWHMTLNVLSTALAGFIFSVLLLWAGIETIWLRYVLSVLLAYGVFLLILAIQVRSRLRVDVDPFQFLDPSPATSATGSPGTPSYAPGGGDFGGGGATAHFDAPSASASEASGLGDAAGAVISDESAIVIVGILAAALAGLCVSVYMIYSAPYLYAELLLDGAVSAALLRRLRLSGGAHWVQTALWKTWLPVLLILVFFGFAGALMQHFYPEARTLGQVIEQIVD